MGVGRPMELHGRRAAGPRILLRKPATSYLSRRPQKELDVDTVAMGGLNLEVFKVSSRRPEAPTRRQPTIMHSCPY